MNKSYPCSTSSPARVTTCFIELSHSGWCNLKSQGSFLLHFFPNQGRTSSLSVSWPFQFLLLRILHAHLYLIPNQAVFFFVEFFIYFIERYQPSIGYVAGKTFSSFVSSSFVIVLVFFALLLIIDLSVCATVFCSECVFLCHRVHTFLPSLFCQLQCILFSGKVLIYQELSWFSFLFFFLNRALFRDLCALFYMHHPV